MFWLPNPASSHDTTRAPASFTLRLALKKWAPLVAAKAADAVRPARTSADRMANHRRRMMNLLPTRRVSRRALEHRLPCVGKVVPSGVSGTVLAGRVRLTRPASPRRGPYLARHYRVISPPFL